MELSEAALRRLVATKEWEVAAGELHLPALGPGSGPAVVVAVQQAASSERRFHRGRVMTEIGPAVVWLTGLSGPAGALVLEYLDRRRGKVT